MATKSIGVPAPVESQRSPGWYADPWREGKLRYWDGETWTGWVWPSVPWTDAQPSPAQPMTAKKAWNRVVLAYLMLLLVTPLTWVILGVVDLSFSDISDYGGDFNPTVHFLTISAIPIPILAAVVLSGSAWRIAGSWWTLAPAALVLGAYNAGIVLELLGGGGVWQSGLWWWMPPIALPAIGLAFLAPTAWHRLRNRRRAQV